MRLSLAASVGTVALLLLSTAEGSSQYKNPRSVSGTGSIRQGTSSRCHRRRRPDRSVLHDDEYDDNSMSSATLESGSGYSSSPSLSDSWDLAESLSSTSSSFYDFDDLKPNRKRRKKRKSDAMDETERVLHALEQNSRDEEDTTEISKQSKRKRRRKRIKHDLSSLSSSLPRKSSKKKRRRKRQDVTETRTKTPNATPTNGKSDPKNSSRIKGKPLAKTAFVAKNTTAATRKPAPVSAKVSGSKMDNSSTSPSSRLSNTKRQSPQPKSHPDRTTWDVPSYSHKISTMMNNKNNESKPKRAAATTLPRTTRVNTTQNLNNSIGGVGSTAQTTVAAKAATTRSTRRTKPTTAPTTSSQTSTLGSTTTPWVRKFLAARPKDRLLPLPRDYISDNFNLAQLPPVVERIGYQAMGDDAIPVAKALQQHRVAAAASGTSQQPSKLTSYPIYRRALRRILADSDDADIGDDEEDRIIPTFAIQKASEALYLLLHARFVISPRGLETIRHVMALDNTVFGKCPRSTCKGTGLLPYGHSNDYTSDPSVPTVTASSRKEHDSCCHRYCPACGEVWNSWESKTDGCAWGPSWCHLFLLAFGCQVYAVELEAAAEFAQVPRPEQPQSQASTHPVRSFRPRGIGTRGTAAGTTTITSSSNRGSDEHTASENLSRPIPSVFGFRIHPSTAFGRPLNEASLRGGSND